MQLNVVHQGMLDIASDYNWSREPLETAYQTCLTSDLTFKQGTLLTEQPSYIDIWCSLNFRWIDDEHFIVESNYKGLISDTWEVDISNGAVLATNRF